MEELLLGAFLACDELHVIDDQHVGIAELQFEVHHLALAQRLDEAVHELLSAQKHNVEVWAQLAKLPSDSLHQVRLTKAHTTVKEEGVKHDTFALGDTLSCSEGHFVGLAHDELVERKTGVEAGAG